MIDLTLGFIGTGGIASAMVRGFCASPDFSGRINLTVHKNREKADALKKTLPRKNFRTRIEPGRRRRLRRGLYLRAAAAARGRRACAALPRGSACHAHNRRREARGLARRSTPPRKSAARAIPLPFAARRTGPLLFYGEDEMLAQLMSLIGTLVRVKSERELEILGPVTGMMVPLLRAARRKRPLGHGQGP